MVNGAAVSGEAGMGRRSSAPSGAVSTSEGLSVCPVELPSLCCAQTPSSAHVREYNRPAPPHFVFCASNGRCGVADSDAGRVMENTR